MRREVTLRNREPAVGVKTLEKNPYRKEPQPERMNLKMSPQLA